MFPGSRRPGEHEDTRANNGANPERGERPRSERFLEAVLRMLGVGDQLVDGLSGEELVGQS